MRDAVTTGAHRRVEFYPEALETFRLPSANYEPEYVALLKKKYADIKVDLVIAVTAYALDFTEQYRDQLWPGVPVVFYSVSEELVRNRTFPSGYTGQSIAFDINGTIDLALRLQPKTRRMVVIGGTADADQYRVRHVAEYLRTLDGRVETRYLTNEPVQELVSHVQALGKNDIVLYTTVFRDVTGQTFVPQDVLRSLSEAAGAPIYWFMHMSAPGPEFVGGHLVDFREQGRRAGELALRVLGGENPDRIPAQPPPPARIVVNARQLDRWGIDEKRLPPNATVLFREPTFWERYALSVSIIMAIIVLQTWLIGHLLVQRRRRRRMESEIRESERRFRSLADNAPIMIWMSGPDQKCTYFNQRWLDFTGRSLAEELGDGWVANVHPDDAPIRVDGYHKAFETRAPFTVEYRLRRNDGDYSWILASAAPRLGGDGEFLGYVGSCLDITDRKQMEEVNRDLAHASRVSMMGQLAAALAHELNQPLGAILRNAEAGEMLMRQPQPDYEEVNAILTDIRKDDQRAGAVIERMRSLLKRRDLQFESLALKPLFDQVVELVRSDLQARQITVEMAIPPDLPMVRGDRVHLQQVMLNLVANGADALNGNPVGQRQLAVRAARLNAATVEVAVHDTGHGIPENKLADLFEPFYSTKSHGMGMGLSIVRTIVESHGGRITAENNPDGGATMRFTLRQAE